MPKKSRLRRMLRYPNPKRLSNKRLTEMTERLYADIVRRVKPITAIKITTLLDYDEEMTRREMG